MKQLALLLLLGCLLACTRKKDEAGSYDTCPGIASYKYTTNSKVDTVRNQSGILQLDSHNGDKLVFKYTLNYNCYSAADENYKEELLFEVPSNATSFSFSNGTLVDANTWYLLSCYCAGVGARRVTHGTIKGAKTNTGWRVEIDIEGPVFAAVKAIKLNEIFTLQ